MDNIPEREQAKRTERQVSLGEEFQLFDPNLVSINRLKGLEYDEFDYRLLLNIEDNLQIPLHVVAAFIDEGQEKGDVLLPFGPREDGYHIDNADYNIETRKEKLRRLHEELQKPLDLTKNQLWLFITTEEDELYELGLSEGEWGRGYKFPEKMLDLFKGLRITLKAPEGAFESMPTEDYTRTGDLAFAEFYPLDLGPLAFDDHLQLSIGFELALPSNLEKLAQIRARFVLVEEEPQ